MKKTSIMILVLLALTFIFTIPALGDATVTPTNPSPAEGTTGVSVTKDFSVTLATSDGSALNGIFLLYKEGVITATSQAVTEQANGTQTFTLPQLDANTEYTVYVDVNNSGTGINQSYNFTTGQTPLTLDTTNFSTAEILIIALITIVLIIAFVVSLADDLRHNKKITADSLITRLVMVIFFVVVMVIIGAVI